MQPSHRDCFRHVSRHKHFLLALFEENINLNYASFLLKKKRVRGETRK
jgi:hypothetical protein